MAAKIGTGNVLFRVGSGSPSKVFLGSTAVQTVPGAPAIQAATYNGSVTTVFADLPSNTGGLPITAVRFYVNDVLTTPGIFSSPADATFNSDLTGEEITVSVVNAIGEGPKSEALAVTAA